jgi:spore germination protein KA
VDGSPFVITVPAIFADFIQASEDYFYSFYVASLMRIVRYIALFLTLLVPGLYIALTTFHQEIIPTPLLVSIAAQREGIPFPSFLEVLIMELSFEIIREAGIRMPRAIGPAISIVGALVLGQAAVEAGLISSLVVIVVAITAISSFAITNYGLSNAIRLLRFLFIFLAASLGLYGITMGMIILVLHLCKIKSAGVPYITPLAPYLKGANKDTILRFPLGTQKKRPVFITGNMADKTTGSVPMDNDKKGKQEIK